MTSPKRIKIVSARGAWVSENNNDGSLQAKTACGVDVYFMGRITETEAYALARRVLEKGDINPDLWCGPGAADVSRALSSPNSRFKIVEVDGELALHDIGKQFDFDQTRERLNKKFDEWREGGEIGPSPSPFDADY